MTKAIVVHVGSLLKCPPAISVVHGLVDLGFEVTVVTTADEPKERYQKTLPRDTDIRFVEIGYSSISNPAKKLLKLKSLKDSLWKTIEKVYDSRSFIWVVSDVSAKALGNRLNSHRYVLHLLELQEEIRYYRKVPYPKVDAKKLGRSAAAVVTAEQNRSYITEAWWGLESTPFVLHNKLYLGNAEMPFNGSCYDVSDIEARIAGRKLILYQGIISSVERPLLPYLNAMKALGPDYVLGVMAPSDPFADSACDSSYLYIPYIAPPNHLHVTRQAYIGVLTYFPLNNHRYSPLNQVYCAPNKVFEFSRFGIPMVGNGVPGLRDVIERYECGSILRSFSAEAIASSIAEIVDDYDAMSAAAANYYNSVDYLAELDAITKSLEVGS